RSTSTWEETPMTNLPVNGRNGSETTQPRAATTDLPNGRKTQSAANRTAANGSAARRPNGAVVAVKNVFVAESSTFYTILGVTLFLVVFGVVMVLSSSCVEQYAAT